MPFTNATRLTQDLEFSSMAYHLGVCSQFLDNLSHFPSASHDSHSNFTPFNCNIKAASRMAHRILSVPGFCERFAHKNNPRR